MQAAFDAHRAVLDAEARLCLAQPGLASLQIILNVFRQTPLDAIFDECRAKGVAVIGTPSGGARTCNGGSATM